MTTTVPQVAAVSEKTLAAIRVSQLRALSGRFHGMSFTTNGRTWRGERGSHAHEACGMGLLWLEVADCPKCLEHEWPGWRIARFPGEGYEATDGERVLTFASRSQLVCRLATTSWGAR